MPDPAVAHTEAGTSPIGAPRQLLFTGGIVLVFVLLLAALVNTVSGLGLPFAGYTLTAAYTVDDNPAPGAPALGGPSAGDRILRMDGQLPAEMRAVFAAAARTGRPVEYVTQHRLPDGTRVPGTAQGGVTVFRLSHWLQIYLPGLLLGGIWWALGTFLYFVGRERRVHQIFLVVSLIISSLVLTDLSTIYTYQETPLAATVFQPLYALLLPLAGASMIQLALFFPVPKRLVVAHPRWHYGVYLLALLIGSANMITRLLRAQETARGLVPPPDTLATVWSSLAGLFTVAGLLVLIGGLLYDRLRARDRVVRRQVALVGLGALLGAGPLVLGELLPLALGQRTVITTQQGYLFLILAPLALAYAIVRYRLFDVTRVLQLGAVYLVASSILLGLYFLLVSGLQALLRELTGQQSDIVALISTLGIAVLFAPLIARAQFYAERVLFRERFLLRQALRDFGARVATLYELDPLAGALVEETSRLLRVPAAALYLCRDAPGALRPLDCVRQRGDLLSAGRTTLQVPDGWVRAAIARPEALDLDLPGVSTRVAAVWELLHNEGVGVVLPLVTGGDLVGVLLLGRKRDQAGFLREELDVLEAIAGQAALALRNAQLLVGRAEQERLRSELDIARTIQRNLLPARLPDLPGLEIAAACLPAQETSGDSYDLVVDEHGTLHVLVADACGKSIPAAMLIALSRNTLRGALRRTAAPGRALSETNEILLPDLTRSQFLAVSCASIDPQAREVRLANAGQMYPLLARPGRNGTPSTCDFLETPFPRLPLGLMGNLVYQETCTPLHPGDVLVCYSDGLVDVAQRTGEQFGFDRLVALLGVAAQEGHGAEEILATLLAAAGTWGEQDTPQDDITLVVVRVCAHEGPR